MFDGRGNNNEQNDFKNETDLDNPGSKVSKLID